MRIWKNICVVMLMLLVISCDNDDEQNLPANNPAVSEMIRVTRQQRNLTQEQLGELIRVQKAQISKLEKNETM